MTVLVKICGLSTPETLEAALNQHADFVGFVFFAKSPRNVTLKQAAKLAEQARDRARIVTLVVDADDTLLGNIASDVRPDFFQAHGKETPERLSEIKKRIGVPIYKVMKVRDAEHVAAAQAYAHVSPFMMYDAMPPENAVLPGGNGLAFDWSILKVAAKPFMLAGGLNPENVAEAIRVTGAAMVDVSSGVEAAPGVKDEARIAKFIAAAKAAG